MSDPQIDGLFSKEAEIGQEDSYLVQLASNNLSRLSVLILSHLKSSVSWQAHIGEGYIRFESVSHDSFLAEVTGSGGIMIRSGQNDLKQLANRLQEMAQAESDPDCLVHVHLDTYFTLPAKGLSDIVFQRLDEYHRGT